MKVTPKTRIIVQATLQAHNWCSDTAYHELEQDIDSMYATAQSLATEFDHCIEYSEFCQAVEVR
jgi:hypothetical protein